MVARCALSDVRISYYMLLLVRRSSSCDNVLKPLRHEGYSTLKMSLGTLLQIMLIIKTSIPHVCMRG